MSDAERLGDVARRVVGGLRERGVTGAALPGDLDIRRNRVCTRCDGRRLFSEPDARNAKLMRTIASNGASLVHWRCLDCGALIEQASGGYWIAHEKIEALGIKVVMLPVAEGRTGKPHPVG